MAVVNRTNEPAAAGDQTAVDEPAAAPRRGLWRRRRTGAGVGGAAAAAGAGTSLLLARIIRVITGIVGLIIALGIVFVLLKASPGNTIVSHVNDWAKWLTTPFHGIFHLHSARGTTALNWGIALIVYMFVGSLLARLVATPARALAARRAAVV
jgi:hypothetical protein